MSRLTNVAIVPALGLTIGLAALATPAAAQQQLPARYAEPSGPSAVSQEEIDNTFARGVELVEHGQFAQAGRKFRAAARMQVRNGEVPDTALWQLAASHYAEDDLVAAATALDELARIAAAHGRPELQARAMLEAAFLYRRVGNEQRATELARGLRLIHKSPYLSAELRAAIDSRVLEG